MLQVWTMALHDGKNELNILISLLILKSKDDTCVKSINAFTQSVIYL